MKMLPKKMWARETVFRAHPMFYLVERYARADSVVFGGAVGRVTIEWEPKKPAKKRAKR